MERSIDGEELHDTRAPAWETPRLETSLVQEHVLGVNPGGADLLDLGS